MHPLTGTWIANLSKSQRHLNHQFQRATMRFEVVGEVVSINFDGVNASGQLEGNTLMFNADGHGHPVPEAPGLVAITVLRPRALQSIGKRDDIEIGRSTYEVADDGQTMTATVSGIDGSGRLIEQVIVFDRESP